VTHDARPPYPRRSQSSTSAQPTADAIAERIRRDDGVELEQSLSPYSLGLARQKSPFSVGEADAPSSQPFFKQSVLSLKEFDDDELMAMNQPAAIISRNDSSGGTEPMPSFYRPRRSNFWIERGTHHASRSKDTTRRDRFPQMVITHNLRSGSWLFCFVFFACTVVQVHPLRIA
jgi:hypothetical protein